MKLPLGSLCLILTLTIAFAGDGIPARGSAEDYPAHQVSGKIAIGAAYVSPPQVKKLFGEDLDKRGYMVFEVGVFPGDAETDISPDDFKLKSKDGSVTRSATPRMVANDGHPQQSKPPELPGNVHVVAAQTVGYEHGPYGRGGVYTDSSVGVSNYPTPTTAPPPPARPGNGGLEQSIEEKSLPDIRTRRAVAGYVFFPKPSNDKHTEYELLYSGTDGQVSLKVATVSK